MNKLNKEAINEITYLLDEIRDIVRLLGEFGIHINSDCWSATIPIDHDYEDILSWDKRDFEKIDISNVKTFTIGGNIITGSQHRYKGKTIIAPKELAEIQGNIFNQYLKLIIQSISLKHFKLELKEPYGLIDNCGWEHYFCIDATIKASALSENKTEKLLKDILNEEDNIIELSGSPINKEPTENKYWEKINLKPKGNFAYMVEFFSWDLIDPSESKYQGCFSQYDYNGKYIRDCMKLINKVEKRAKELADKYTDKNVKVTVNDFNEGCQYGMAIYVWIPYQ